MSTARRKRYMWRWVRYRRHCHRIGGYAPIRRGFANAMLAVDYPRYQRRIAREGTMTEIDLAVKMAFTAIRCGTDAQFETFLEQVLVKLDRLDHEANLAAKLTERHAEFAVTLTADDFEEATIRFLADLRTALHAAECKENGWQVDD